MNVAPFVRAEFDRLLDEADQWPSHWNVQAVGGFILRHPEIVGREELPCQKANRLYREESKTKANRG